MNKEVYVMKKPWLAALLNIIPGLGYLYLGVRKPFAILLLVGVAASFLDSFDPEVAKAIEETPVTAWGFISLVILVAFPVDAYHEAKNINAENKPKKSKEGKR